MYIYTCVLFGTLIPTAIEILIALISKGLHMVLLWYAITLISKGLHMVLLLYAITPCLAAYIQSLFLRFFGTAIPTFSVFTLVYMWSLLSPNTDYPFYTYAVLIYIYFDYVTWFISTLP